MHPPDQENPKAVPVFRDYPEFEPPPPLQEVTKADSAYKNYREYEPPPSSLSPWFRRPGCWGRSRAMPCSWGWS